MDQVEINFIDMEITEKLDSTFIKMLCQSNMIPHYAFQLRIVVGVTILVTALKKLNIEKSKATLHFALLFSKGY